MIFGKKKFKDEAYFDELLKGLTAYELAELFKSLTNYSKEMMKLKELMPQKKNFEGFA